MKRIAYAEDKNVFDAKYQLGEILLSGENNFNSYILLTKIKFTKFEPLKKSRILLIAWNLKILASFGFHTF